MVHLGNDWDEILAGEFEQDYYKRIRYWLKKEYAEQTIYPAAENIFNALRYTPYSKATKAPDVMEIGRLNTRYRHSRAGPVSRSRTGARTLLLGSAGCSAASEPAEHLQGAAE